MDQEVVNSLGNMKLTKEEEEDIVIANSISSRIFEECSLSLFGRLLSDCHQNLRALKNTLKAAWKMGSDLRIVEVGNNILQFKYERLPTFCYRCGILGHDEKHCQASLLEQSSGRQYGEWMKAGGVLKVRGEKEKLKEQSVTEKGGSASMVVDDEDRTENGVGGRSSSVLVVDGGVEPAKGSVSMMEADQLDFVMNPVMSNHRKHGELVRWEERLPKASNSEKEQNAREGLSGDRTNSVRTEWNGTEVGQHVVSKEFGPDLSGAGNLSPIKIKETKDLRGEKKNGPDLNENEGLKPIVQAQPHCPDRVITQGAKGRIKKIARDKRKAQEVVKFGKAMEVSNKRKTYNDMLFISQSVHPLVVAANPLDPNQFAVGLTDGSVKVIEPTESEGKWGSSPPMDNGILNGRTASSSTTSNHTPDQTQR
nr:protein tpr1 [Quercus suber]